MLDNNFLRGIAEAPEMKGFSSVVRFFESNKEAITIYREHGTFYALPFLGARLDQKDKMVADSYLLPFFWMYYTKNNKRVRVGVKVQGLVDQVYLNDIEVRVKGEEISKGASVEKNSINDLFGCGEYSFECDGEAFGNHVGWVQCVFKTKRFSHIFQIYLDLDKKFDFFAASSNRAKMFLQVYAERFIVNERNDNGCRIYNFLSNAVPNEISLEVVTDFRFFSRKKIYPLAEPVVIDLKQRYDFTPRYRFYIKSSFSRVGLNYRSLKDATEKGTVLSGSGDILFEIQSSSFLSSAYRTAKSMKGLVKRIVYSRYILGKKISHEEAYSRLSEFEHQSGALEFDLASVKIWQASRFFQFNSILTKLGVFKSIFESKKKNLASGEKEIDCAYRYVMRSGSPILSRNTEISIFDNLRKYKSDLTGEYYDRDTASLINTLKHLGYTFTVFEQDHLKKHYIPASESRKYMDAYKLFLARGSQSHIRFTDREMEKIKHLGNSLSKIVGVYHSLEKSFAHWLRRYILEYTFYFHVLRSAGVKWSFVVGPYRPWHHEAAKNLNIRSVEIQYAAIVDHHSGYDFDRSCEYSPDYFFAWGEYWKSILSGSMRSKVLNVGFPENNPFKENSNAEAVDVLFISQSTIGDKLFKQCLKLSGRFPDKRIKYRLHPHENKKRFETGASNFKNIIVSDFRDESLDSAIASASCVVGVYSTALFEAFDKGCNVVIINLTGAMHMERFKKITKMPAIDDVKYFKVEWMVLNNSARREALFFDVNKINSTDDGLSYLLSSE